MWCTSLGRSWALSASFFSSGSGSDQPDWSDDDVRDEVVPGTASNGEQNPFDEDASGVRVRALYDYQGQEQDELSFAAGRCGVHSKRYSFPLLTCPVALAYEPDCGMLFVVVTMTNKHNLL